MQFDFTTKIIAGDSYVYTYNLSDYLPTDGWVLNLQFIGSNSTASIISTSLNGTHVVSIPSSFTSDLSSGAYNIVFYVTKGSDRTTLYSQRVDVQEDFTLTTSSETVKSFNEQMVEALESLLLRRATNFQLDMLESEIDTKRWKKMSPAEIQALLDTYKRRVQVEQARAKGKSSFSKRILYTFQDY